MGGFSGGPERLVQAASVDTPTISLKTTEKLVAKIFSPKIFGPQQR